MELTLQVTLENLLIVCEKLDHGIQELDEKMTRSILRLQARFDKLEHGVSLLARQSRDLQAWTDRHAQTL
jgi:hypothetical protein